MRSVRAGSRRSITGLAAALILAVGITGCTSAVPVTPPAPASPVASATPAAPASPVTGVVLAVTAEGLTRVKGFRLRTDDGQELAFEIGILENGVEFPPGHLAEHLASAAPVRVSFRAEGDRLVVYRIEDASAG